ncbi:MAG: hypothetical protein A4E65_02368 [Syntrophorhabdus sp. PtaU1.Bin153]|nr:MAG: hypothetical protein A4E65_02368 [Syntrophorhabdus sp. PtaU1.Bin153]
MEISIKLEGVEKALRKFDPDIVRRAANQAINRVAGSARTEASKLIRQEYNIKASRVSDYLMIEAPGQKETLWKPSSQVAAWV